jgi:sugar lactone lactonase YvrE
MLTRFRVCATVSSSLLITPGGIIVGAQSLPSQKSTGQVETVVLFQGSMPTGVTVSRSGRIFVNFPRWGDPVPFTVAEVRNGKPVAYPNPAINRLNKSRQAETFVSVQSVVVDPQDRLWILDTGSPMFQPTSYGGPKLIGIDLRTNRTFQKILFPKEVALPTSYLNDVRFDLRRGKAGMAFITDSSDKGPNGIVVVDLASGRSWRKLHNHPSTKAVPRFLPYVEGMPILQRKPGQPPKHLAMGSDGIALSADGKRLFYCPLASRNLYSVSADALADEKSSEDEVAATVTDHGEKGASDGMEMDAQNRLYVTNYEQNAIQRRRADGTYETIVSDPRVLWPDTLSVAADGYLYFTANQLHRQKQYHNGKDLRKRPYVLFRTRINSRPVTLR